ncbi:hypothetical protein [Streptomyces sp. NPDC020597]|uniref:hypothetical protein n=1 Tax=unclassified Streptomyces TaxID=2593676 RepID=UPI00379E1E25
MSDTSSRPTAAAAATAGETCEELARQAAELVTSRVSAGAPLSQDQQWELVGLQNTGSAQGEMHAFARLGAWQRQLAEALESADGSEEGRDRVRAARSEAVSQMRDMLLSGIPSAERLGRSKSPTTDPRAQLRSFIGRNRRNDQPAEQAATPRPHP